LDFLSDENLIQSCLKGVRAYCNKIFERYKGYVSALAYRMVHDREAARDITQETFLRVFKGLKKFKADSSLKTWLYRITINQCIDHIRKSKTRQEDRHDPWEEIREDSLKIKTTDPGDQMLRKETRMKVREAINELSPEQKAAVLLCDIEGFSYGEAAEALGIPAATVGTRVHYARKRLRELLEPYTLESSKE